MELVNVMSLNITPPSYLKIFTTGNTIMVMLQLQRFGVERGSGAFCGYRSWVKIVQLL